jgi:ubiquitin-protein ligase
MDGRQERLMNDYQEMVKLRDTYSGMLEFKVNNTYRHYDVILHGIRTYTVNRDGGFGLEADHAFTIVIPAEYPLIEPTFTFAKTIFHPNWYADARYGKVCLGILRDNWDPSTKLKNLVIDTIKMMTFEIVNPDSPANLAACIWYKANKESIRKNVLRVPLPQPSDDTMDILEIEESAPAEEDELDITEI